MIKTVLRQFSRRGPSTNTITFNPKVFMQSFSSLTYAQQSKFFMGQNRSYFSTMSSKESVDNKFSKYISDRYILDKLQAHGLLQMFPIQQECFPLILEGRDILASDRTGSGKTLAYTLPILENIYRNEPRPASIRTPKFLILSPTRELALQVSNEIRKFADKYKVVTLYGGSYIGEQITELKRGAAIIVATPGRLMDLMDKGVVKLSQLQAVCIDEADTMLEKGFKLDVEEIMKEISKTAGKTQNLLFSATIPHWVANIAKNYLKNMQTINMIKDESVRTSRTIEHYALMLQEDERHESVLNLIQKYNPDERTIIFTKTKVEANNFIKYFEKQDIVILHGDITQSARQSNLKKFRNGEKKILIATDVAARGLDIPNVELIIQLSPPQNPEPFIHRAGRTGRAGKSGINITFFDKQNLEDLIRIEEHANIQIKVINNVNNIEQWKKKADRLVEHVGRSKEQADDSFLSSYVGDILSKTTPEKAVLYFLKQQLGKIPEPKSAKTGKTGFITYKAYPIKEDYNPLDEVLSKIRLLHMTEEEECLSFDIDWKDYNIFAQQIDNQDSYEFEMVDESSVMSLKKIHASMRRSSSNNFKEAYQREYGSRKSSDNNRFSSNIFRRDREPRERELSTHLFVPDIPEGISQIHLSSHIKKQYQLSNFSLKTHSKQKQSGQYYSFGFLTLDSIQDCKTIFSKKLLINDREIPFKLNNNPR